MANCQYLTKSPLRQRALYQRLLILSISLPLMVGALFISPLLTLIIAFFTYPFYRRTGRWLAGAQGEEKVIRLLRRIPDRYTLFNNVQVPTTNGHRELDAIIVGDNGLVFVIEVKNLRGKIQISNLNKNIWRQTWKGDTRTFSSPVRQLRGQIFALKDYMRDKNLPCWIEAAVVISHRSAEIDNLLTSYPTLPVDDLLVYLQSFDSMRPQPRAQAMIEAIAELVPTAQSVNNKTKVRHTIPQQIIRKQ